MVLHLSAQSRKGFRKNYFNGHIVTNYGDTLFGRIKSDQNFTKKVKFISDSDTSQKKVTILVADIRSMKLNLMLFEKVILKGKMRMFEKVAYGYYDLFAYNYQRGDISEDHYLLKLREQTIRIEERNFKDVMERYVFDCPELRQKVIAQQYQYDDTIEIFRFYNRWKSKQP